MSVTIKIGGYPDLISPIGSIQQTIERFIADNNLILKQILFAGGTYFGKYNELKERVRNESTVHLVVYPIISEPQKLFDKLKNETGGWLQLGKSKSVATLASGQTWWFSGNWINFTVEKKESVLSLMTEFLTVKNGYQTSVQFYEPVSGIDIIGGDQYFFYVPDFFRIACEIVGITEEQAKIYICSWTEGNDDPKKKLLVYLVFGDYYKPYMKKELQSNEEFMRILHQYNTRIGLPEPDTIPNLEGGSTLSSSYDLYKTKYLKYKEKYIKLKQKLNL